MGRNHGAPGMLLALAFALAAMVTGARATTRTGPAGPVYGARHERPPDVVVILLDSLRADQLDRWAHGRQVMPRLAAWASRNVVFTAARAPSPSTPTSVAALLTSVPVGALGVDFGHGLPEEVPSLPAILVEHGWHTRAWSANPNCSRRLGHARGFERFVEAWNTPLASGGRLRPERPERIVPPDRLLARVRADLEKLPRGPHFLYVHLLQPHAPYDPPAVHRDPFSSPAARRMDVSLPRLVLLDGSPRLTSRLLHDLRDRYDGHCHWVDAAVGDFLAWLDRDPRFRNAAVFVLADHGEAFGEHGRLLHNTTVHEEMLRIPLLYRPPGGRRVHRVVPARVDLLDVAPTVLALAGIPAPATFRGIDLGPLARGQVSRGRGRFLATTATRPHLHALLVGRYKVLQEQAGTRPRLYDLATDPGEVHDLAAARPDTWRALARALRAEIARLEGEGWKAPAAPADREERELLRSLGYVD